MEQDMPTVTVALPAHDGAATISAAVESLLSQTFRDFELIISDDGSRDDTVLIAERYAHQDSRVRVMRQPAGRGAAAHFNAVFRERRGRYFMWAAQDDRWRPQFIEHCVQALDEDQRAVAAVSAIEFLDEAGRVIRVGTNMVAEQDDPAERLGSIFDRIGWFALYALMRPEFMERTHLYQPVYGGDVLFMAEMLVQGRFVGVPEPLFGYRYPSQEKSAAEYARAIAPNAPVPQRPMTELLTGVLRIADTWLRPDVSRRARLRAAELVARVNTEVYRRLSRENGTEAIPSQVEERRGLASAWLSR
jgi:glycosyltransferase involved in cell wall biosynthesis